MPILAEQEEMPPRNFAGRNTNHIVYNEGNKTDDFSWRTKTIVDFAGSRSKQ